MKISAKDSSLIGLPCEDLERFEANWKTKLTDFEVEEVPLYNPSGTGPHLYLFIEKTDLNTADVCNILMRHFKVKSSGIGYAGLKDKFGVTRQWFSVENAKWPEEDIPSWEGLNVLTHSYHENKLRTGHLKANKFKVILRGDFEPCPQKLQKIRDRILGEGLPNFYGPQRFGFEGRNIATGYSLLKENELATKIRSKRKRSLFISAFQSLLFNEYVIRRLKIGSIKDPIAGERWTIGGSKTFTLNSRDELTNDKAVPSGPIFGSKYIKAENEALRLESEILDEFDINEEDLKRNKKLSLGTRRPIWINLEELQANFEKDTIVLEFTLPTGSYAINVVSCFTKQS